MVRSELARLLDAPAMPVELGMNIVGGRRRVRNLQKIGVGVSGQGKTSGGPEGGLPGVTPWREEEWRALVDTLVSEGVVTWQGAAEVVLESVNPPQVGTSMTTADFQRNHGVGTTWQAVKQWLYGQSGVCINKGCGTRSSLQADHKKTKQEATKRLTEAKEELARAHEALQAATSDSARAVAEADVKALAETVSTAEADQETAEASAQAIHRVDNMVLRCRRHNVVRRESHKNGGLTPLPTAAAMMWLLFEFRPRTYEDYLKLVRLYGLTMASIRAEESWAMAVWLARDPNATYEIEGDDEAETYVIEHWEDGAVTRRPAGHPPADTEILVHDVPHGATVGFLTRAENHEGELLVRFHEVDLSEIPLSVHDSEGAPPALLAMERSRAADGTYRVGPLPPGGLPILVVGWRIGERRLVLSGESKGGGFNKVLDAASRGGRLESRKFEEHHLEQLSLEAEADY